MKTVAIKIKSYVGNVSIVDNNDLRARMFHFMMIVFGALALSYVLILGNMIFNIVERKGLESEARILSNEVRDLELSYLSLSNKVDLPFSYSIGFREARTEYTTRKSLGIIGFAKNEI